jgi:uncharacterized OsmC-like protein
MAIDIRASQQPLKEKYRADPADARLVHSVYSLPVLDDPTRVRISNGPVTWEMTAHPMAGGPEGEACSGDVLLAALAGCQTITIKMVAASMGVVLNDLRVTVTGEMDFRGTMGIDRSVPVGYTQLHCEIAIQAEGDPDRLRRLVERAEQYCVVRQTLVSGVPLHCDIKINETVTPM